MKLFSIYTVFILMLPSKYVYLFSQMGKQVQMNKIMSLLLKQLVEMEQESKLRPHMHSFSTRCSDWMQQYFVCLLFNQGLHTQDRSPFLRI